MKDERKPVRDAALPVLLNGMRWANNILVEVLSQYARSIDSEGAKLLAECVSKLADAERVFREHV